jgi:hypothetical protein
MSKLKNELDASQVIVNPVTVGSAEKKPSSHEKLIASEVLKASPVSRSRV